MTLQVLRNEIGDADFFRLLQRWAQSQAGGNVTTDEFIALAEKTSARSSTTCSIPGCSEPTDRSLTRLHCAPPITEKGKEKAPKQVRAMLKRFGQEYRLDNPATLRKTGG